MIFKGFANGQTCHRKESLFNSSLSFQNDLAASVQEMVKSQKIYFEEEKQAHDTRVKAMNAEDKLRRRSTSLFSTMAQLHRNRAKVISIILHGFLLYPFFDVYSLIFVCIIVFL